MKPMNMNDMMQPNRDPIKDVSDPKMGMALATMYARMVMPKVQLSQTIQWVLVLAVKCFEPRRTRTRTYFPGIYTGGC
jgi:hypothetical protein